MIDPQRQLSEDRLLRDAARTLFLADIERVKADFAAKTVGRRAIDRAKDGAAELFETAQAKAGDNVGILAMLFGAVALWLARNPILGALDAGHDDENPEAPMGEDQ